MRLHRLTRDILIYLAVLLVLGALILAKLIYDYEPGRTITVEDCGKWVQLRALLDRENIRHQILPNGDLDIDPEHISRLDVLGGGNVFSLIDDPAPGKASKVCPQRDLAAGREVP